VGLRDRLYAGASAPGAATSGSSTTPVACRRLLQRQTRLFHSKEASMPHRTRVAAAITLLVAAGLANAAPPKVVTLPNSDPQCFAPWASNTKLFQFPAKTGPYRVALANGYIANTWRIQMIKTAKAYAAQPDVAAKLKEFKVVSTGEDVAAQIAAINNFIDSGYDAVVVNAQNPAAFKPVIKRANDAGVVLVAFDNILDTEEAINVNVDQKGLGKYWAEWLVKNVPNGGKVLEVRGVSAPRSIATGTTASRKCSRHRARSGTPSKSSASGTTPRRRRSPPTRSPCTRSSTPSLRKAVTPVSCRR
jgi:hypothetical protein